MELRHGRVFAFVIVVVVLSSCGTLTKFSTVNKDDTTPAKDGLSVVVWRLHITDYTKEAFKTVPVFKMSLGGDEIKGEDCVWTETENAAIYDCFYVVKTRELSISPWEIRIGMVAGNIWSRVARFLEIRPGRSWTIGPGSMRSIGEFVVEIYGIEPGQSTGSWVIEYSFEIEGGEKSHQAARLFVEQELPATYKAYGRTLLPAD